jgi:hypothetical protein
MQKSRGLLHMPRRSVFESDGVSAVSDAAIRLVPAALPFRTLLR